MSSLIYLSQPLKHHLLIGRQWLANRHYQLSALFIHQLKHELIVLVNHILLHRSLLL